MIPLLRACAGLIGWAIAFSALYALQGAACASGWQSVAGVGGISVARLLLILTYAMCIVALGWLGWRLWPRMPRPTLLDRLAAGLALVGLASLIFTGLPVAVTSTCL